MQTSPHTALNGLIPMFQQSLQDVVSMHLEETFPALSLAVWSRGNWKFEASWGWVDPETHSTAVTLDSLFDLASVTKLYTATAFLSLVSEGKVRLDDALVDVIPEFGLSGPRPVDGGQDPISKVMLPVEATYDGAWVDPADVRFIHLLTHTSGLAPWRHVYRDAGPAPKPPTETDPLPRDVRWQNGLKAICSYPFVGAPDGKVRYSDLGLMLLGEATARLHGTPGDLEAAIQQRVLGPLGSEWTMFNPVLKGLARERVVPTEIDPDWRQRRVWGEVHDENACGVGGVAGHAGLFSTAKEVASFGVNWLKSPEIFGVDPDLAREATREHVQSDGARRGLGWQLRAEDDSAAGELMSLNTFGHTGFTGTSLWIDPTRDLVVACLTNRVYPGRDKPGIHEFRRAVNDVIVAGVDAI